MCAGGGQGMAAVRCVSWWWAGMGSSQVCVLVVGRGWAAARCVSWWWAGTGSSRVCVPVVGRGRQLGVCALVVGRGAVDTGTPEWYPQD